MRLRVCVGNAVTDVTGCLALKDELRIPCSELVIRGRKACEGSLCWQSQDGRASIRWTRSMDPAMGVR